MGKSKFALDVDPDPEDLAAAQKALDANAGNVGFLPGSRDQKEKAGIEAAKKALHIAHVQRVARDNAAGVTSEKITAMRQLRLKAPGCA